LRSPSSARVRWSVAAPLLLSVVVLSCSVKSPKIYPVPGIGSVNLRPGPKRLRPEEEEELKRALAGRFVRELPQDLIFAAVGPFDFVRSREIQYTYRTDLASAAFEHRQYGVTNRALDPGAITEELLLARIHATLVRLKINLSGIKFAGFQDEYAGAVQPAEVARDFDPRKHSVHVARTASFKREEQGVPVFGSELLVGVMPDGQVGRLRLHWPKLDPIIIVAAQKLQEALRARRWSTPEALRDPGIEILDIAAGVGHSGFTSPGFGALPVIRVLVRKTSRQGEYALVSTSYRYFDATGREVRFSNFPAFRGSSAKQKRSK
jgi:hypothetical protein